MHQETPLTQSLGQILMLVAQDFQQCLDTDLSARGVQGISARHRTVFLFLGRNGPSRAVDLAEAAGIRPQSMMKIVHEIESLGLVERHQDPADSRAKLIGFTKTGHALIRELAHSTTTVWQQYAAIVGEQNLMQSITQLKALVEAKGLRFDT